MGDKTGQGEAGRIVILNCLPSPPFLAGAASRVQCLNNYGIQGRRVDCQWHRHQALEGTLFYLKFSE